MKRNKGESREEGRDGCGDWWRSKETRKEKKGKTKENGKERKKKQVWDI